MMKLSRGLLTLAILSIVSVAYAHGPTLADPALRPVRPLRAIHVIRIPVEVCVVRVHYLPRYFARPWSYPHFYRYR